MARLVVGAVLLASPATLARPAPPPRDADAWCRDHDHVRFAIDKARQWSRVDDGDMPAADRKTFSLEWRGYLDPDRRTDVILNEGSCGTRECIRSAYVQCRDGSYAQVYSGYAASLEVHESAKGWARLTVEHVGDYKEHGPRDRGFSKTRLTADAYQEE